MSNAPNITADNFPKQSRDLGKRTAVIFHFGGRQLGGTIVRDDYEEPWHTIIKLDDGRYVLSTECQYAPES